MPAAARPLSTWEYWGRVLVVPYLLVFVVFVLYPVCYGLWLAEEKGAAARTDGSPCSCELRAPQLATCLMRAIISSTARSVVHFSLRTRFIALAHTFSLLSTVNL